MDLHTQLLLEEYDELLPTFTKLNEIISKVIRDDNFSSLLVFSNIGKMYHINTDDLPINSRINISQLCEFSSGEKPTTLTTIKESDNIKYLGLICDTSIEYI